MEEVFLIKEGEIVLKGLNKASFEKKLIKNIKNKLNNLKCLIKSSQSTILIQPEPNVDLNLIETKLTKIFGIARFCRAFKCEKNLEDIFTTIETKICDKINQAVTFRVCAKRSDKNFYLNSQQIGAKIGEMLINKFPHLKVNLSSTCDLTIYVEIRSFGAYVYSQNLYGCGGIPVGCSGSAMLLISGGIDSPVAGWLMAKRGVKLHAVHFYSPPYTSVRALDKVEKLISILSEWTGPIAFFCVNFTEIQKTIKSRCCAELSTIINRRIMNKIAEKIALSQNLKLHQPIKALINGESLGQVASQTLNAISCTKVASNLPIFQPLIGLDKIEIIALAKKINTYSTSILPFDDCCTVFVPPHPRLNPTLNDVLENENKIENLNLLIDKACENLIYKLI